MARWTCSASPPPARSTTASRTLIGRLLLDSKAIFEDQLEAVEATAQSKGYDYTDLALLTDGLRSEREQGITIDVAYRYFATPERKFIIADTPGHVQYTRNMVTGASTADLGLVLVDARQGLTEQSRRHAVILSLLRVPHLVLAVNKMDLVDYDEEIYDQIHEEFTSFATKLQHPRPRGHPDLGAQGRQRRQPLREHALVLRPVAACTTSSTCTSPPTATWSTPASRCSTSSARSPTSTTTTAATPARSPAACSSPATRSWCCPAA